MTPDGWRRAGELFHEAMEIAPEMRDHWVEEACGGDAELHRELAALIESDRQAARGFIGDQVKAGIAAFHENDLLPRKPRRAGPYWLVRELGVGGMGTVYLGRRDDEHYTIDVAVKVVTPGMDTEFVLQRFRRERQILANLRHPNIAQLLDGGTTEEGLPYIVMEYIEGAWITDYCDANALSIDQRLKLFLDVCSAVEHAHRNFVVHRDIKPGNILVDKSGVPKLLDFGICKLLYADPMMAGSTIVEGARMLTPDYASPEQIRGDPVTIASDVYSLAVVLYELLTRTKPHRFENYTLNEIERVICTEEIVRPSLTAPDRGLARRLSGDLDNILLHALQKETQRRYASVEQLAEDIRRHLSNLPVRARPDTFRYRTGKLVRRYRAAILAIALVFVSLVGGLIAALWQSHRADRRFAQVRELANSIIFDLSESIQDIPGSTEARAILVRKALPYLDSLATESSNDPKLLWELARAYEKIGGLQGQPARPNLGRPADALESFRKAIRILDKIVDNKPVQESVRESLIATHQSAGFLETQLGNSTAALKDYGEALRLAREHHAARPDDEERQRLLSSSYNRIGDAQLSARDPQAALQNFEQGLRAFGGREPRANNAKRALSVVYMRIGDALLETGPIPKAVENLRHATEIRQELLKRNQASLEAKRDLFVAYITLGNALGGARTINIGDRAAAQDSFRKALDIAQELAKHDPKNARARGDLAFGFHKMGEVTERSDSRASAEWFRQSLSITQELLAAAPNMAETQRLEAERRTGLAEALYYAGDKAAALTEYHNALEIWRSLAKAQPLRADFQQDVLSSYCRVCDVQREVGNTASARASEDQALSMIDRIASNRSSFYSLRSLANCYETFARLESRLASASASPSDKAAHLREARAWYRKSLDIWNEWRSRGAGDGPSLDRRKAVEVELAALAHRQL